MDDSKFKVAIVLRNDECPDHSMGRCKYKQKYTYMECKHSTCPYLKGKRRQISKGGNLVVVDKHDKGKRLERDLGKFLLTYDGMCPIWGEIASSTGRIGHITELGMDVVSHTYVAEAKHRESMPQWFIGAWEQILEKGETHNKVPLLAVKKNRVKIMHIITEERHAELLECEKLVKESDFFEDRDESGESEP